MPRKTLSLALLMPSLCCGQPAAPIVRLTIQRAMQIAAARNPNSNVEIAQESERIAEARYAQAHAVFWPTLDINTIGQNQTRNLNAQGFQFASTIPGVTIPSAVGPFNTLDLRVTLNQAVLDMSAIRRSEATRASIQAARADTARTREDVASQAAHAYARLLRENGMVEATQASIVRASATLDSARNKQGAGTGTAIDVTRAQYQLAREEHALAAVKCEQERAGLALLDILGLSFDTRVEFQDGLRFVNREPFVAEQSVEAAMHTRADFEAERRREENLRLNVEAVRLERLPTIAAYADAGTLGGVETHTIGVAVRIPIFDGGRRKTKEAETAALLRQQQARGHQLRRNVELAIRQSEVTLRAAAEDVSASQSYMELAETELAQARRRHDAGLMGTFEVIEAQFHLATAARDRVDALYRYTEARIDLQYATGSIRELTL